MQSTNLTALLDSEKGWLSEADVIHTGFYAEGLKSAADALKEMPIGLFPKTASMCLGNHDCLFDDGPAVLLDGECNMFAKALNEAYGYPVYEIVWERCKIAHYFCYPRHGAVRYFIDARGITSSAKEFIDAPWRMLPAEDYDVRPLTAELWVDENSIDEVVAYTLARELLERCPSFYSVEKPYLEKCVEDGCQGHGGQCIFKSAV